MRLFPDPLCHLDISSLPCSKHAQARADPSGGPPTGTFPAPTESRRWIIPSATARRPKPPAPGRRCKSGLRSRCGRRSNRKCFGRSLHFAGCPVTGYADKLPLAPGAFRQNYYGMISLPETPPRLTRPPGLSQSGGDPVARLAGGEGSGFSG